MDNLFEEQSHLPLPAGLGPRPAQTMRESQQLEEVLAAMSHTDFRKFTNARGNRARLCPIRPLRRRTWFDPFFHSESGRERIALACCGRWPPGPRSVLCGFI